MSQHDTDSLNNVLKVWVLENDFDENEIELNDTSVEMFHNFRNREKYSILTSNLGNIGSASISDLFFKRFDKFNSEFSFNEPYFIFIKNSQNISYYNTRRPYTSVMHTTSTKINDIQTIDFTHTQNVHPDFNFGLDYDFTSSVGQFEVEGNQSSRINSVGLSSNFKKNKYSLYLSYAFNKFVLKNSGGYVDTVNAEEKYPKPKLSDSNTSLLNQDLSITQKYKFGSYKNLSYKDTIIKVLEPKISISHNLTLQRKYRIYEDTESDFSYYPDFFYQEGLTYDSIGYKAIVSRSCLTVLVNYEHRSTRTSLESVMLTKKWTQHFRPPGSQYYTLNSPTV